MRTGVTCVGGMVVDLLAVPVNQVPAPGRLELVKEMKLAPGGCAVNSSSALGKLGVPSAVIGKIGTDGLGDYLLKVLNERGVNTAGVRRAEAVGTSASMVLVFPDGERAFVHTPGAAGIFSAVDIDWDVAAQSRIFFIAQALLLPAFDGEPSAGALRKARERGMLTALDTVWDATGAWMEKIGPCLPHLDYFLPSYDEAKALSGLSEPPEMARFFMSEGAGTVAIKLAEKGCYVATAKQEWWVSGFKVDAVDATGAGDAWCAGFFAGLLKGLPLQEAARLGNAAGALCVTGLGAYAGIRDYGATVAFMEQNGG